MVFDRSCQMALRSCFSSFPSFSAPKMTWGPVLTVKTKIQKSSRVRETAFSLKVSGNRKTVRNNRIKELGYTEDPTKFSHRLIR